jgi:hypothetical protein
MAQFRVPFKVPFNTASAVPQATLKSGGPSYDKSKPLRDPDGALEKALIDPVDDGEEGEEALPCGSDFVQPRLKCGHGWLKFSLSLSFSLSFQSSRP